MNVYENESENTRGGDAAAGGHEGDDKSFRKEYADAVKQRMLDKMRNAHDHHRESLESLRNWRAWGSWFSWGSPVGFGIFIVAIGVFLVLLHYAGLIGVGR